LLKVISMKYLVNDQTIHWNFAILGVILCAELSNLEQRVSLPVKSSGSPTTNANWGDTMLSVHLKLKTFFGFWQSFFIRWLFWFGLTSGLHFKSSWDLWKLTTSIPAGWLIVLESQIQALDLEEEWLLVWLKSRCY